MLDLDWHFSATIAYRLEVIFHYSDRYRSRISCGRRLHGDICGIIYLLAGDI